MFRYYLWQQYVLQNYYNQLYHKLIKRQNDTQIDISGVWNTDYYGRVVFEQDGDNIQGTFKYGIGRINGILDGNVLIGEWSDAPTYECPLYRGRLRFEFSPQTNSFKGFWGICEEPLNKDWNGVKLQDSAALDVSGEWFTTTFGKITLVQEGDNVTGNYEYKNGRIEGTLHGYTLIGNWFVPPTQNCPFDKGRMEIDFGLKGREFTGVWSYCENEPKRIFSGIKVDNRKYT